MAETLEISEVYRAAQVLRDVARHPRLIGVPKINPEAEVYLKPENLQHTGAFKLRGAYYKNITAYSRGESPRRNRMFSRKPCTGSCACSHPQRHKIAHLPSSRSTDFKNRGHQASRC